MNIHELLKETGTLMQFSGKHGFGWYARGLGRVNKWGFHKTSPEAAMAEAQTFPLEETGKPDDHIPVVKTAPPARPEAHSGPEPGRVRIRPAETPSAPSERVSIRRNRGFFD